MTPISSSLIPMNSASQLSIDSLLLGSPDAQQNQDNADNIFGSSYSLNLSDTALSALYGNSSAGNDSTGDVLGALTYSNYSDGMPTTQSVDAELGLTTNSLGFPLTNYQYSAGPVVPTSMDGSSFQAAELADGGPLPAFLAYVDKAMNLNSQQVQSLDEIATAFQNAPGTQQTVNGIAAALQQAGIPETI